MTWHLLMLNVTVKDGERALLTRNGQLVRVLAPGKHRLFDPLHELKAEVLDVVRSELSADRYAVLKAARPDLGPPSCSRRSRPRRTRSPSSASTAGPCI